MAPAARLGMPPAGLGEKPRVSEFLRGISLEYSYQELTDSTHRWSTARRLGSGSYGAVYRGEMEDGSEVAIKAIDLGALGASGQTADMAGFEEEVQTLSKFRHPNLVTLLGWGKHGQFRYLVYELMTGGDVFERMQKSRSKSNPLDFPWYERISALLDAATGLSHMHNSKPKAFHRDIKSANILLDRHGTAKMADFGLSCIASGHGPSGAHVKVKTISGTPGYACPIYARTGRVTEGSEVYSFGMVIVEILTSMSPASADSSKPGGIAYPISERIKPGSAGAVERCVQALDDTTDWPPQLSEDLAALGVRCINATDESQRPRFVEVVRGVRGLIDRFPRPKLVATSSRPAGGYNDLGRSDPASPDDARQLPVARGRAPFTLELVAAEDIEVDLLSAEQKRLPLIPSTEAGGRVSAFVGRQHQQELFEAWLPKNELRSCISRLAFEVSWASNFSDTQIVARGNNPVTLGGKILARGEATPLALGDEVGFPYSQSGELALFLRLRFCAAPRPAMEAAVAASAPTAALAFDFPQESSLWALRCIFVEGLGPEELPSLPMSAREFLVEENSQVLIGRQHQPKEFEALLAKAPTCMSFISRSHVQLEARNGMLTATNVSSNPVYVDGEPLGRGTSAQLLPDQVMSFARLEGSTHALFVSFQVYQT